MHRYQKIGLFLCTMVLVIASVPMENNGMDEDTAARIGIDLNPNGQPAAPHQACPEA